MLHVEYHINPSLGLTYKDKCFSKINKEKQKIPLSLFLSLSTHSYSNPNTNSLTLKNSLFLCFYFFQPTLTLTTTLIPFFLLHVSFKNSYLLTGLYTLNLSFHLLGSIKMN